MKSLILTLLMLSTATLIGQTNHFNGTWTKINTTYEFDFELILTVKGPNQVEGYFNWTVVRYDENDLSSKQYYENKLGMTATEYVRGTYDQSKGMYTLNGYKKNDPNLIIGIDIYNLKLGKGGNIEGKTNANGTWLGRIRGTQVKIDLM